MGAVATGSEPHTQQNTNIDGMHDPTHPLEQIRGWIQLPSTDDCMIPSRICLRGSTTCSPASLHRICFLMYLWFQWSIHIVMSMNRQRQREQMEELRPMEYGEEDEAIWFRGLPVLWITYLSIWSIFVLFTLINTFTRRGGDGIGGDRNPFSIQKELMP